MRMGASPRQIIQKGTLNRSLVLAASSSLAFQLVGSAHPG